MIFPSNCDQQVMLWHPLRRLLSFNRVLSKRDSIRSQSLLIWSGCSLFMITMDCALTCTRQKYLFDGISREHQTLQNLTQLQQKECRVAELLQVLQARLSMPTAVSRVEGAWISKTRIVGIQVCLEWTKSIITSDHQIRRRYRYLPRLRCGRQCSFCSPESLAPIITVFRNVHSRVKDHIKGFWRDATGADAAAASCQSTDDIVWEQVLRLRLWFSDPLIYLVLRSISSGSNLGGLAEKSQNIQFDEPMPTSRIKILLVL